MQQLLGQRVVTAAAVKDPTQFKMILISVGIIVLVGLVSVLVHRFIMQSKAEVAGEVSMTRPILALLLVGTVLILAAASVTFEDADTRNLLIGGVISLSSAAVAYYFASSGATEARRDLLAATSGTAQVPNLVGKTLDEAGKIMGGTFLKLDEPVPPPDPAATVKKQDPLAGAVVRGGQSVKVDF